MQLSAGIGDCTLLFFPPTDGSTLASHYDSNINDSFQPINIFLLNIASLRLPQAPSPFRLARIPHPSILSTPALWSSRVHRRLVACHWPPQPKFFIINNNNPPRRKQHTQPSAICAPQTRHTTTASDLCTLVPCLARLVPPLRPPTAPRPYLIRRLQP